MWHRLVKASKEAMDDINEGREREGLPKLRLVKDVREELEVAKTERESKGLAFLFSSSGPVPVFSGLESLFVAESLLCAVVVPA
jgi:hypothetical protein